MADYGKGELRIGLSGWNYVGWKNGFYAGVPQKRWLAHAARQFNALEINATFYRQQEAATLVRWREQTPQGFVFAPKGHRFSTHAKKLIEPEDPIRRQRAMLAPLGDKASVVLWQLPDILRKRLDRLERFAALLREWREVRHAIEFRHGSWFDGDVADCLARHGVANCLSDASNWPLWEAVTTDVVYVRLHGRPYTYASSYETHALEEWAGKVEGWRSDGRAVHVYFDNDAEGAAPRDAVRLIALLGGIDWPPAH